MADTVEQRCIGIFRDIAGLANPGLVSTWDDRRLLTESLEAIDIDSETCLRLLQRGAS